MTAELHQMALSSHFTKAGVWQYLQDELEVVGVSPDVYVSWLKEAPRVSTFRVNTLVTNTDVAKDEIRTVLQEEMETRCKSSIPNIYQESNMMDVLIIESWPEKELEDSNKYAEDAEVVVDVLCGAAVLRGAHIFAPGILALPKGIAKGQKVNISVDIEGKCLQGTAVKFEGKKMIIGQGILLMDRSQLFGVENKPQGVAVQLISTLSGCTSFTLPKKMGILQNLPSSIASWELGPLPGQTVLDMCAAPGNKTTHLAALMENQGVLIGLDRSTRKTKLIVDSCESLSVKCLTFACDSTKSVSTDEGRDVTLGPPFSPNSFDKIMLDAPCSALGQRPQFINKMSLSELQSFPPLQKRLFDAAVCLLKPGGELVYSTCTITHCENEGIVEWALNQYPNSLCLLPPRNRFTPVVPGTSSEDSVLDIRQNVQRFGPPTGKPYCDSIGFFIARFKKIS